MLESKALCCIYIEPGVAVISALIGHCRQCINGAAPYHRDVGDHAPHTPSHVLYDASETLTTNPATLREGSLVFYLLYPADSVYVSVCLSV